MKRLALLLRFVILMLFTSIQLAIGQSFPVQITPQAVPPAPIYFSDYADGSTLNSPLRVQIALNALGITNREIRLKVYFEGNGIAFQSNDLVTGATPLFVEGGIPLVLTNVELAPYFKFENIIGISPAVYGKPIPEGAYNFCFEVFDAITAKRISDRSCAATVIFQNEPPILITPENRAIVENRNPQNIIFQWVPRHVNVSNVEYQLSIVEIWDNQVDPQAAFLSSPPIFQTRTNSTTYVYGPADPLLLKDKNYAWRVQAIAKQGTEEIGTFKNQGYSEIFYFGHSQECDLPLAINAEVKGSTNANILWQDNSTSSSQITVRYRKKGTDAWFEKKSTADFITIWDLEAGTEYEYQIAKTCALAESEFSLVQTFRTNLFDDDDSTYNCGIAPDIDVTNQVPLESLTNGDKFTAGDFPVTVMEVSSGGNGRYTGKGYVTIPYLKSIKVAVEFTNIFINENKELAQGHVVTLYDPSLGGIIDPWDFIDDVGDIVFGGDHRQLEEVDFPIENAELSEDGEYLIISGTDSNGKRQEVKIPYDEADTYEIVGTNGGHSVGPDGIEKLGDIADGGTPDASNTGGLTSSGDGTTADPLVETWADNDVSVAYSINSKTTYGFDEATSTYEKENYPKVNLASGGQTNPVHKAVLDGATDTFLAEITINNSEIKKEDLVFKTVNGIKLEASNVSGNTYEITVKGSDGYHNKEGLITYKKADSTQVVVSSFFIHHLKQLESVNVVLVEVDGYSIPNSSKDTIAGYFANSGANLNIEKESYSSTLSSSLQYNNSAFLSNHPESFKEFNKEFKNTHSNYSANTYYIFAFDDTVQPGNNLGGFMPRGSQFGFVFSANINPNGFESKGGLDALIGHEIGHGVFDLKHPFEAGQGPAGTDWLMDYGNGTALSQENWKSLGYEGIKLYLFDKDEDGKYGAAESLEKIIQLVRCQYKNNELNISSELKQHLAENSRNTNDGIRARGANAYIVIPSGEEFSIVNLTSVFVTGSPLSELNQLNFDVSYKLENAYHKFNLGDITINISKTSLKKFSPSNNPEDFKKYLLADDKYDFTDSIDSYVSSLISDNDLSNRDYDIIKSVANCEAENFKLQTRIRILNLVSSKWVLSGYYEDLIFDLMRSTPKIQFDSILEELQKVPTIYTKIFKGNEGKKGESRLLDELFRIWEESKFYKEYHDPNSNYDPSDRDVEFYREFKIEIEKFIYSESTPECLNDITNLSSRQLSKCISILDRNEIMLIDYESRKYLIEKLLTATPETLFSDGVSKDFEVAIVRLLKLVPDGFNNSDFINYLKQRRLEYTLNVSSGGFGGQTESLSVNSPIIQILFNKIDDSKFLLSGDYRKELVDAILTRYYSSTEFNIQMDALEAMISGFELDGIIYKNFEFEQDYQNIFRRLWTEVEIGASRGLYTSSKAEYSALISKLVDNTELDINIKQVIKKGFSFRTKTVYEDDYDPFELVLLTNKSNINIIQEYSLKDVNGDPLAFPAPAILVHYIVDSADNKTRSDILSTAFDAATLVIPGGQIVKLSKLGKLAYYADKASAISSIASTAFEDSNHPELKSLFQSISIATGIVSLSPDALKGGVKLRNIVQKKYLNKSSRQIVEDSERLAQDILDLSQSAFDRLSAEQKQIVFQILENDSGLYTKSGITFNKSRLDDAIQVLKTGRIIADDVVTRGVSKRKFWESIEEFKTKSYAEAKRLDNNDWKSFEDAWKFFENENWSDLENLFSTKGWNGGWPPSNGFSSIDNRTPVENLDDNFVVDRFQTESSLGGSFASPVESYNGGTNNYNYIPNSRALREPQTQNHYHFQFRIKKNGPRSDLTVEEGPVMPWFGVSAEDAGRQIRSNVPFHELNHGSDLDNIIVHQKTQNGWRVCVTEGKEVLVDLQNQINKFLPPVKADKFVNALNKSSELKALFKNSRLKVNLISAWESGIKNPRLLQKLEDFSPEDLAKFTNDIVDTNLKNAFDNNPDLVDGWKFLSESGVDDAIRKNVDAIADPDAALDAIQASGKTKPTWPEIQALFKRGNDFNKKARTIYPYSEIVLKGIGGKAGKRLDSYIPNKEIISRKATTLSNIEPNTFKKYLNELITKYPVGSVLNSNKLPKGTKLSGDYFLEIPLSNKGFFDSSGEFQKLLSDFNTQKNLVIKIKYLKE